MKVAILQSNYIPWKGYFDLMNQADVFVLYDSAQFTSQDWRNRNRIKTPQGLQWLTIPVRRHRLGQSIAETQSDGGHWRKKHWRTLEQAYRKAPFFEQYRDSLRDLYLESSTGPLSLVNHEFLSAIQNWLNIETPLMWDHEFELIDGKTERLVHICQQLNATAYLSGPAAESYLEVNKFTKVEIEVEWMNYGQYPTYEQVHA
ncbi:MAG: WbqC family protein, partial [Bacteroidota bacterium]